MLTRTAGDERCPVRLNHQYPNLGKHRSSSAALQFPAVIWQISSACVFLPNIFQLLIYFILIDWTLLWCNSLLERKAVPDTKRKKQLIFTHLPCSFSQLLCPNP